MSASRQQIIEELKRRGLNPAEYGFPEGSAESNPAFANAVKNTKPKESGVIGNFAKGAGRGATATVGMGGDLAEGLAKMPEDKFLAPGVSGPAISRAMSFLPSSQQLRGGIDKAVDLLPGADPNASIFSGGEDTLSGRAGEFTGGAAVFGAPGVTKQLLGGAVKQGLQSAGRQTLGAGIAGAGSYGGEQVAGMPGAIVGAFAPGATFGTAKSIVKVLYRDAGKRSQDLMKKNLQNILTEGGVATAGSTAGTTRAAAGERIAESFPGAVSVWRRVGDKNAKGLRERLATLLTDRGFTDERAGKMIAGGLKKQVNKIRLRGDALYEKAEKAITNPMANVNITNTKSALDKLAGQNTVAGWDDVINAIKPQDDLAANLLEKLLTNPNAIRKAVPVLRNGKPLYRPQAGQMQAVTEDVLQVPWKVANQLRKTIGIQINHGNLIGDARQGVLKDLYRALSKDVKAGAVVAGGDEARIAFNHANNYWRGSRTQIDKIIKPLLAKEAIPENLFRAVTANSLGSSTLLRNAMKDMSQSQRAYVVKRFVAKLGKMDDVSGVVSEVQWSPGLMLRNWDKIASSQKNLLFKGQEDLRKSLDRFFHVLKTQKDAAGVLNNPSGTAGLGMGVMNVKQIVDAAVKVGSFGGVGGASVAVGSALGGPAGGMAGALISPILTMALANGYTRMITSPKILNWMADAAIRPNEFPKMLARLNILAQNEDDPETVQAIDELNTIATEVMDAAQGVQ